MVNRMRMDFEKTYSWIEFLDTDCAEKIYYFKTDSSEDRANDTEKIEELRKRYVCEVVNIGYCVEEDTLYIGDTIFYDRKAIRKYFEDISENTDILINISAMNARMMGMMVYQLYHSNHSFNHIWIMYTEPEKYTVTARDDEDVVGRFELYKRFKGIKSIPGFVNENIDNRAEKWVVFLGFEGGRAFEIMDTKGFEDIVAFVTIPAFRAGWQNVVFQENFALLKEIDKPEYVIANSYLDAYYHLERIKNAQDDTFIYISPLGTKINTLGAFLYAIEHTENVTILFDNPIENERISENEGMTYIFDVSESFEREK